MPVERIAPAAKAVIFLLSTAVFIATVSVATHSHWHTFSHICLALALSIGFLAFLKILNHIFSQFFMARFFHWLHAMCGELLAFSFVACLKIVRLVTPKSLAFPFAHNSKHTPGSPILLVHGYCNDRSVWAYVQRKLVRETESPVFAISLGSPFRSMNEHVKKVIAEAEKIRQETGKTDLILMGHSMGGVICLMVATLKPDLVSTVFTIGSPLGGTSLAKIGWGANAREMERSSKLLSNLKAELDINQKTKFYHIATKTDQIVFPCSTALRGTCPEREFLFEDIGHASLLFSPRVANLLIHWLKQLANSPKHTEDLQCKEGSIAL